MSEEIDAELNRIQKEFEAAYRKVIEGAGLTEEQKLIADNFAVNLAIAARQMRFEYMEKNDVDLPSILDAVSCGLAFVNVDFRERTHRANPIPPPPWDEE